MFNSSSLLVTRDEVRTESGLKKSGFCQKIKVRTLRTKVRTQTDLKNGLKDVGASRKLLLLLFLLPPT